MVMAAVTLVTLMCQQGTAKVSTYGGVMTSWKPIGSAEVFAMAKDFDSCERGMQIHGGFPLCWPWAVFEGPQGCKIHGVTRYCDWTVKSSTDSSVVLELNENAETLKVWPHRFHLELTYAISNRLEVTFRAVNTDDHPYACTELFHPYFNVGDVTRCRVTGMDGLKYFWKGEADQGDQRRWSGDFAASAFKSAVPGYVFEQGDCTHQIVDEALGRRLQISYAGNIKLCIWNSGVDFSVCGESECPDFGRRFLCFEGGTLYRDRAYVLKPGETHVLKAAVSIVK